MFARDFEMFIPRNKSRLCGHCAFVHKSFAKNGAFDCLHCGSFIVKYSIVKMPGYPAKDKTGGVWIMALKYKRILLKISGEALGGEKGMGFDEPTMDAICGGVKKAHELGVQIGIVVGGGNFWRGRSSGKMERTLADKIGMLATVMNALAVSDKLEQLGVPTEVFTSITMPQVAPAFTRKDALRAMDEGKIAVFGGGTGNPFFSTDTATALRAVEVSADVMFKATMVDGVYDKDPHKYPDAKKYDTLTFTKVLEDQLAVMDGTAATMCRDNKLPILVFDLADPDNIARAVQGENVGTLVYEG